MKKNSNLAFDNNCEIVVAHYNEDLEWLRPYAKNAIVYHKGNENKPRFPVKQWIKLDNLGREGQTYLYHIINNYDNLADVTIFLQGGMHDQLDNRIAYRDLTQYEKETIKYGFSTSKLGLLKKRNPQIVFEGKFKEQIENGSMRKSKYSFEEFYLKTFHKKQPYLMPTFFCANFAASRKVIKGRDKNFYEELIKFFDHQNPEEGHYLERFWFAIFNKSLNAHYLFKIIKNLFD